MSPESAGATERAPGGRAGRAAPWLGLVLAAALALRVLTGLAALEALPRPDGTPASWWETGYTAYGAIGVSIAEGRGMGLGPHRAQRPPAYPLLLAGIYLIGGQSSLVPVVAHALLGTATAGLAFLLGRSVFGARAGLAAAAMTAAYPYYVAHDTALQETALFTLLTALTVHALLAAQRRRSPGLGAAAGVAAGLAVLCRESLLPFVLLAPVWLARGGPLPSWRPRVRVAGAFLVAAALVVAPWLVRNTRAYGVPVFAAGAWYGPGYRMWVGHNEDTLAHYPWGSIDRSTEAALARLDRAERARLDRLGDLEADRWFFRRAAAFVVDRPGRAAWYALVKVAAALGPLKSPLAGGWLPNVAYTASYLAVAGLALLGVRAAAGQPLLPLVGLLGATFIGVAVLTHAHTSHRSFLDVYLIVLGAGWLGQRPWRRRC